MYIECLSFLHRKQLSRDYYERHGVFYCKVVFLFKVISIYFINNAFCIYVCIILCLDVLLSTIDKVSVLSSYPASASHS